MGLLTAALNTVTGLFTANKARQAQDKQNQEVKNAAAAAAEASRQAATIDFERARGVAQQNRDDAKADAAAKFSDLRNAAITGGFNPLTALTATGGAGFGDYGGSSAYTPASDVSGVAAGAAPLASISMLGSVLDKTGTALGDIFSGKAAQDEARDRLNLDLGQVNLDQARWNLAHPVTLGGDRYASGGGSGYPRPGAHDMPTVNVTMPDGSVQTVVGGDPMTAASESVQALAQSNFGVKGESPNLPLWTQWADKFAPKSLFGPGDYAGKGTVDSFNNWLSNPAEAVADTPLARGRGLSGYPGSTAREFRQR
jgi:hypothetical protein